MNTNPKWLTAFDTIVEYSTAGLPQDKDVKWTHLSRAQIQAELAKKDMQISLYHVGQMLKTRGFKKRKMLKKKAAKEVEGRNAQFEKIASYRECFSKLGMPVISIDTKKKELIGNFCRAGSAYSTKERQGLDHDFFSKAECQIVPHGIFDVNDNKGYITLGTSKDTSEFVCDNLRNCWLSHLQYKYANSDTCLLLCDGGGSNASTHYIVKHDLIKLSKDLNINILVAHYPPYCSKWNPIEHRLFSQVTHTWDGVPFLNIEFVKELTNKTTTKTGLEVITSINTKTYLGKRIVDADLKKKLNQFIVFDDKMPQWNYLIKGKT